MSKSALQVRGHFKFWPVLPPPTSDWLTVLPLSLWMEYFGSQNIFPPPCHHATEQFTGNNFKRLQMHLALTWTLGLVLGCFFVLFFLFFFFIVTPPPLFSVFLYYCLIRLLCVVVVFHTVSLTATQQTRNLCSLMIQGRSRSNSHSIFVSLLSLLFFHRHRSKCNTFEHASDAGVSSLH